jgi:membrane-associated phospholipid phosphatase
MRAALLSLSALALVLATSSAAAQVPAPVAAPEGEPPTTPVALHHDVAVDLVATGVLAGGLVAWTAVRPSALRSSCVICDGTEGGGAAHVNGVDDFFRTAFRRRDGAAAETASTVVTYGVAPVMGLALTIGAAAADRRADEAPLDTLLVAEASLAAIAANEAFGALLRRPRPDASAGADGSLSSFPSGSAASIMGITAASATIATLRGYRLAPLVWIMGTTVGLTATYLRMAADKSYFTDNLAGAAIGMSVGALVPILFHRRVEPGNAVTAKARWLYGATLTTSTVPGGRIVGLGWSL